MKKIIVGILLGFALVCSPVQCHAMDVTDNSNDFEAIEITYEEAQELLQIAEAEAGNQGPDGQWLVMSVVINRVRDDSWPDNIHDVIHQESQFYAEGMKAAKVKLDGHEALARIEQGDLAPQIIAFERKENTSLRRYFSEVFTYKDHVFYVEKEQ